MDDLHQYYRTRLAGLALGVALTILFVPASFIPWLQREFGEGHFLVSLADVLTSRIAIVIVLAGGEYLVRTFIWRIEKKEWDFDGLWNGQSTYQVAQIGTGPVPFTTDHQVRIKQTCLTFALAPAKGSEYINWGSLALRLVDKDSLQYAYWVNYSDTSRFPDKAKGFEEMRVTERDEKGRPIELTGTFSHCAEGQSPVYSGKVIFTRA